MVFLWNLTGRKSSNVSRTLPSILTDLNNAVVWRVSSCPLISKSSSPFTNVFEIVSSGAPISAFFTVTLTFHRFFYSSLERSIYLFFFSLSFVFTLTSAGTAKSTIWQVLFLCWLSLGLVFWPELWKCNQPRLGFECVSPCLSSTITSY